MYHKYKYERMNMREQLGISFVSRHNIYDVV